MKEGPVTKAEAMAAALNEFLDVSWEVEAAAVVSPDGLPMASALPPDVEEDRLAAMSASLLTLGERAAHNLNRGELAQVLVEGERGYVLLMAAGPSAVLVAVTSHDAKVGLVLFEMKKAVESIAAVMDGSFRQPGGATLETEIAVDAAAIGDPEAFATSAEPGVPPAPPERIWESGSSDWQSGTAKLQPAAPETGIPAGTSAVGAAEPDDAVAAEHPRGSDFSVPGGAAEADPAAWDAKSSSAAAGEQEASEDGAEHPPTDREAAAAGWHQRRSQNSSQESPVEEAETAEPAESEPAPSWR